MTDDRRLKLLHATEAAKPITEIIRQRYTQLQRRFLCGVSARHQARLETILQSMYHNLCRQPGSDKALPNLDSLTSMHLIGVISRLNSRHFYSQLKQMGFTRSQWLVLVAIDRHEGLQQSELAQELNMRKAPLGVLVDDLEAGDWVERRIHPQDRRARTLHLTSACRRQLQSLGQTFENLHTRTVAGIGEHDRKLLRTVLQSIRNQLKSFASESGYGQSEVNP